MNIRILPENPIAIRDALAPRKHRPCRLNVALVAMPFATTRRPSIQLGLLKAILAQHGIRSTTHHLNLKFAAAIGWETYEALCASPRLLLGEWIFSEAAFRDTAPEADTFLERYADDLGPFTGFPELLRRIRVEEAAAFVSDCLRSVAWDEYDVVGFSSMFDQNTAAIAMARAIKEAREDTTIVFGGANFEDEMGLEYVRALPWIDYAVVGEGDEVLPELLFRLEEGADTYDLPGVASRRAGVLHFSSPAAMVKNLDDLPMPDYDDFFAAASELELPLKIGESPRSVFHLLFESARGCWWGAKHHCTFCGLNGSGMAFRSKSPERVIAEVTSMASRHNCLELAAVDNILDMRYIRDVFGVLAEKRTPLHIFYEVKANLTYEQLRTLSAGGVKRLQPGIESLSTSLLKLMRKGSTGLQNICFLKWAAHFGMQVDWNILVGFPGEQQADYEAQLRILRLIPHFPPPINAGRIRLDRFSPHFKEPAAWRLTQIRPDAAYAMIYPPGLQMDRIAYYFDYTATDTIADSFHDPLYEYVDWWQKAWRQSPLPRLLYRRSGDVLTITDERNPDDVRTFTWTGPAGDIFDACHAAACSMESLRSRLRHSGRELGCAEIQALLDEFVASGLMLQEGGRYIGLANPGPDSCLD